MSLSDNDMVHLGACVFHASMNLGLFWAINQTKQKQLAKEKMLKESKWVMTLNYILLLSLASTGSLLDEAFPATEIWSTLQAWLCAFSMCLLDFYLDPKVGGLELVPILKGWGAWCGCYTAAVVGMHVLCGRELFMKESVFSLVSGAPEWNSFLQDLSLDSFANAGKVVLTTIFAEWLRLMVWFSSAGFLTDVFFSPIHRMMHTPALYQRFHKTHHHFQQDLTSFVLFYGSFWDDLGMAMTPLLGNFLSIAWAKYFGWEAQMMSTTVWYVFIMMLSFSHAHNKRLANLVVPLPDALNFIAYHRIHHVSPDCNFGLLVPTDIFYDFCFGKTTVRLK